MAEVSAMERIKQIEKWTIQTGPSGEIRGSDSAYLIRAFRVMREIAKDDHDGIEPCSKCNRFGRGICTDQEFERRMKEGA